LFTRKQANTASAAGSAWRAKAKQLSEQKSNTKQSKIKNQRPLRSLEQKGSVVRLVGCVKSVEPCCVWWVRGAVREKTVYAGAGAYVVAPLRINATGS
jgi:hypothetical protein